MGEELGRITKPEAEQFKKGRRIFLTPLIFVPQNPPDELEGIAKRYWDEVRHQIAGLERRIGKVSRIYHEMVSGQGKEAINAVHSFNSYSNILIRNLVDAGAEITSCEDSDILNEYIDWGRCISMGLYSHTVLDTVFKHYQDAQIRRSEASIALIDKTLGEDEIGLLIVRENHNLQFPADVEVFYVAPPSLDEYKKWFRQQEQAKPEPHKEEEPTRKTSGKTTSGRKATEEKETGKIKTKPATAKKKTKGGTKDTDLKK